MEHRPGCSAASLSCCRVCLRVIGHEINLMVVIIDKEYFSVLIKKSPNSVAIEIIFGEELAFILNLSLVISLPLLHL
jgi:hypothetical protein